MTIITDAGVPCAQEQLPPDVQVLQRGWLSSNNIVLLGEDEAAVVDTGYVLHADQTVALVRAASGGRRLSTIVNTHVHSDHCGGNALLQQAFGSEIWVPIGIWDAVQRWDTVALSYQPTGQRCERFKADRAIKAGERLSLVGRVWDVIAAPGHEPDACILFDARDGLLISADALWENGFGVVFPELEGERAFDQIGAVLDAISKLPVSVVIPGHGAPFTDVTAALTRARTRLDHMQSNPIRHARHAAKVLIKFHLSEHRAQHQSELVEWGQRAPLLRGIWSRHFQTSNIESWIESVILELAKHGVLQIQSGMIVDR